MAKHHERHEVAEIAHELLALRCRVELWRQAEELRWLACEARLEALEAQNPDAITVELIEVEDTTMGEPVSSIVIEVGQTKRYRVVGKTKGGAPHAIENLEAALSQGTEERFGLEVAEDILAVTMNELPGDVGVAEVKDEAGVVVTPAVPPIPDTDPSLSGAVLLTMDGRIGDGVKPISKTFAISGHLADAVDATLEELEE